MKQLPVQSGMVHAAAPAVPAHVLAGDQIGCPPAVVLALANVRCTLERLKLQLQMLIGRWVGAMELVQRAELLGWFDRIQRLVLE